MLANVTEEQIFQVLKSILKSRYGNDVLRRHSLVVSPVHANPMTFSLECMIVLRSRCPDAFPVKIKLAWSNLGENEDILKSLIYRMQEVADVLGQAIEDERRECEAQ